MRGLVTSVNHGRDFVSSLNLGVLREFRKITLNLSQDEDLGGCRHGKMSDEILRHAFQRDDFDSLFKKDIDEFDWDAMEAMSPTAMIPSGFGSWNRRTESPTPPSAEISEIFTISMTAPSSLKEKKTVEELQKENDWCWSLIKTLRADMQHDRLYPSGDVFWIHSSNISTPSTSVAANAKTHRVVMEQIEDIETMFSEIHICKSMFLDHSPERYEWCLNILVSERDKSQ